jgi:hypothetical protein
MKLSQLDSMRDRFFRYCAGLSRLRESPLRPRILVHSHQLALSLQWVHVSGNEYTPIGERLDLPMVAALEMDMAVVETVREHFELACRLQVLLTGDATR